MTADPVLEWLLAGDPAIRWQAERDLLGEPAVVWEATRARIAGEGWGARLLEAQDPGGTWGGGLYSPKWTSTTYTLLLLMRLGLAPGHPGALAGARRLLDDAHWVDGGVSYWTTHRHPERCVNGMVLAVGCAHGVDDRRLDDLAAMLIDARLEDGGWNCRDIHGDRHSSFHTTASVLDGLAAWRRATGRRDADGAIASGQEFWLAHRMVRSHRTGEVIEPEWLVPHFPPRWHYDVLRGLDHLQAEGAARDARAAGAVESLRAQRRPDGRWPKGRAYGGKTFFALEPGRVPGRWTTLRALRVLRWWEGEGDRGYPRRRRIIEVEPANGSAGAGLGGP